MPVKSGPELVGLDKQVLTQRQVLHSGGVQLLTRVGLLILKILVVLLRFY